MGGTRRHSTFIVPHLRLSKFNKIYDRLKYQIKFTIKSLFWEFSSVRIQVNYLCIVCTALGPSAEALIYLLNFNSGVLVQKERCMKKMCYSRLNPAPDSRHGLTSAEVLLVGLEPTPTRLKVARSAD